MQPTPSPALSSTRDSTISTAYELLRAGRVDDAEKLCQGLLALTPNIKTAALASTIAEERDDLPRALQIVDDAIEHHGVSTELLLRKAQVLMRLRRRTEGVSAARRAAEICPPDARLLQALAKVHSERNEPAEAKPLLQRARELLPLDPAILYDSAVCHFYLNEMEEAAELLERVLTLAPGNGFALYVRSQLGTQTVASNHVGHLREMLLRPQIRRQDAISTYFALAKELEDIGEYQESFAALSEGNRIKRGTLDYDVRNDVAAMQKVMAHYTRDALAHATRGDPSTGPIFILGMPRTGTTLVERILGSHSDVVSLGELVDFPGEMTDLAQATHARIGATDPDLLRASLQMDFAELGRNYLNAVRPLAGDTKYFVDKLPFNFRYCGLIHQALPNAKIVHLTRDPLDTCYAIFKTLFINAYHYSYQLDETRAVLHRLPAHDGPLARGDAGRHLRRQLRRTRRRSARAMPQAARILRFAVAGRGARVPPVAGRVDDGQCRAGAQADLPVVGQEVAQLREPAAARGASTRRGGARGRRRQSRLPYAAARLRRRPATFGSGASRSGRAIDRAVTDPLRQDPLHALGGREAGVQRVVVERAGGLHVRRRAGRRRPPRDDAARCAESRSRRPS